MHLNINSIMIRSIISCQRFFIILSLALLPVFNQAVAQVISLDECHQRTLDNNLVIKQLNLDVEESKQLKKELLTNFFPKVSVNASAMQSSDYLIKGSIPAMNLPVYDGNVANLANPEQFAYFPGTDLELLDYTYMASITVAQPIYAGGQVRNGVRLAGKAENIHKSKALAGIRDELLTTDQYYWRLASLIEKRKTIEGYNSLLNALYKDVDVAYRNGLVQRSDMLKVQLKQNELSVKALTLENGIEMCSRALCRQMGMQYNAALVPADSAGILLQPQTYFEDPETAVYQRPEYKMLETSVEVAGLRKKLETGALMPSLAVGVMGSYYDVMEDGNTIGIAFATLSIPISDWWGGSHKIKQRSIEQEKARQALADNAGKMLLQHHNAYNQMTEAYQKVELAKVAIAQTSEHLNDMKQNFEAGACRVSDLLDAQAMWQQSTDNLSEARYHYLSELAVYQSLNSD